MAVARLGSVALIHMEVEQGLSPSLDLLNRNAAPPTPPPPPPTHTHTHKKKTHKNTQTPTVATTGPFLQLALQPPNHK